MILINEELVNALIDAANVHNGVESAELTMILEKDYLIFQWNIELFNDGKFINFEYFKSIATIHLSDELDSTFAKRFSSHVKKQIEKRIEDIINGKYRTNVINKDGSFTSTH